MQVFISVACAAKLKWQITPAKQPSITPLYEMCFLIKYIEISYCANTHFSFNNITSL